MGVKRVYVEKKPEFAVQAKELRHEVKSYLGIKTVKNVRVLIRYDVENLSDATFERACNGVFAEPPVDVLYREDFPREESDHIFSVEFLPGQFDQRADSAVQCVQFIKEDELPVIKTATTYVIEGEISEEEMEAIKAHCINPVDSRETGLEKPETLVTVFPEPETGICKGSSQSRQSGAGNHKACLRDNHRLPFSRNLNRLFLCAVRFNQNHISHLKQALHLFRLAQPLRHTQLICLFLLQQRLSHCKDSPFPHISCHFSDMIHKGRKSVFRTLNMRAGCNQNTKPLF
mgnify:CR=1 FL=1